jgi:hypothetical protein
MISLRVLCLLLIAPGVICAQSSPEKLDSSPNNSDIATELKTLREALLQTQRQKRFNASWIERGPAGATIETPPRLAGAGIRAFGQHANKQNDVILTEDYGLTREFVVHQAFDCRPIPP